MATTTYSEIYQRSMDDPEGFWSEAAESVEWITPPGTILDADNAPFYRWFRGGVLNVAHNALDRHVAAGRGDQAALIYDSPSADTRRTYSYSELLDEVSRFAGVLRAQGVEKGDRVVVYMPMIPEALIAMVACARIGAIHSVVFGGFAPAELRSRIEDAAPKVVVSASCGIERGRTIEYKPMLDAALVGSSHVPDKCIIKQREQAEAQMGERDVDWDDAMAQAQPADCVPMEATDPLYVLYTSGTTGRPKGIVRDTGGYAVALTWSMPNLYDVHPGDVWFCGSDVGWVVGHSYIVYAPLLAGATTVLYEGKPVGTPDAGAFWRLVADYGVSGMFTAPTAIRAIRKEDPQAELLKDYDVSSLRHLFLAGERLDPDTYEWATEVLGVPVVDNWWQTETGWPIATNPVGIEVLPLKAGSPTRSVVGYDVRVLDELGEQVQPGTEGSIAIKLPLPPGTLPTLWGDDERFVSSYLSAHEGYYTTGDGGYMDEDGYIYVLGRTDDVLNVAGHRLSAGTLEAALAGHEAVAECAVIGVADTLKGQVPRGVVVLKSGYDLDDEATVQKVQSELIARVRAEVGAVASLRDIHLVAALPKTRSGKILRKTMRQIAEGAEPTVPSTIEDRSVLDVIAPVLRKDGEAGGR